MNDLKINDLLKQSAGIRLDIACGANKNPGFVGIDVRPLDTVDVVHDLEQIPWPLPDECVLTAVASHFVEHINPARFGFINFMNEVWRVMKIGGQFAISTPHGSSSFYIQDPTHINPCNATTFAYFDPLDPSGLWSIYQPSPWQISFIDELPIMEVILVKRHPTEWENGTVRYE